MLNKILLTLFSLFVLLICYPSQLLPAASDFSIEDLEKEVQAILKCDEIVRRRNIDKVFELAALHRQNGEDIRAIELYEVGLTVNAANLHRQLELAWLLAKNKRENNAVSKAKLVYELAEEEVDCEEYEFTIPSTGKKIKLAYTYVYNQEPAGIEETVMS